MTNTVDGLDGHVVVDDHVGGLDGGLYQVGALLLVKSLSVNVGWLDVGRFSHRQISNLLRSISVVFGCLIFVHGCFQKANPERDRQQKKHTHSHSVCPFFDQTEDNDVRPSPVAIEQRTTGGPGGRRGARWACAGSPQN